MHPQRLCEYITNIDCKDQSKKRALQTASKKCSFNSSRTHHEYTLQSQRYNDMLSLIAASIEQNETMIFDAPLPLLVMPQTLLGLKERAQGALVHLVPSKG